MSRVRCGTDQGYKRHRRHGEDACAPCRAAHADANRARRPLTSDGRRILIDASLFTAVYLEASIAAQERVEAALGQTYIDALVRAHDQGEAA